jgi:hypothetical protein
MSYPCGVCGKACQSNLGLIQHTEAAHGRSGVFRGVGAWEQSRGQAHEITRAGYHDEGAIQYDCDQFYNSRTQTWDCPHEGCSKVEFGSRRALEQHLESGAHEESRYDW